MLVQEELMVVNQNLGHQSNVQEEDLEAWRSAVSEFLYLPSQERYGRIASATNSDKIESLQASRSYPLQTLRLFERLESQERKLFAVRLGLLVTPQEEMIPAIIRGISFRE